MEETLKSQQNTLTLHRELYINFVQFNGTEFIC